MIHLGVAAFLPWVYSVPGGLELPVTLLTALRSHYEIPGSRDLFLGTADALGATL